MDALKIEPGAVVADLGAVGGYFTFWLAKAVGPGGRIYAVDVDEASHRYIEEEAVRRGGMPRHVDPRLPPTPSI